MQNKHTKSSNNYYYMYGKHAVFAALINPKRHIENIFCTQEIFTTNQALINKHKYQIVTTDYLAKLLGHGVPHQGITAKVASIFSNDINDINFTNNNCRIVILDQITDPQNIGAIVRSAAAFEITAIIIPSDNAPDENAAIAKAASGTLELIKIIKVTNLKTAMERLKKEGFWLIGLDGKASEHLNSKLLTAKIAIALGSEDKGLRRLTKETCDYVVKIPTSSQVESLNVSNAASIIFYLTYTN